MSELTGKGAGNTTGYVRSWTKVPGGPERDTGRQVNGPSLGRREGQQPAGLPATGTIMGVKIKNGHDGPWNEQQ